MNNSEQLTTQIYDLNDGDLLEGSIYYFSEKYDVSSRDEVQDQLASYCASNQANYSELMTIVSQVESNREACREMLQFLLINEASYGDAEYQKVRDAVNAVGQKQIITEVGLAIILGTLAMMYLTSHTGGKEQETHEIMREVKPDGSEIIHEKTEIKYSSSSSALGALFDFFKNIPGK